MRCIGLAALALVCLPATGFAQPTGMSASDLAILRQEIQPIRMIKPGLYWIAGGGGNSVVRVTDDKAILIDDKNAGPANFDALTREISEVSPRGVGLILTTHHHDDHIGNDPEFAKSGVEIEIQASALKYLSANPKQSAVPRKTYEQADRIDYHGAAVALFHEVGHTEDDTVVYFPDKEVVVMGDLYTVVTPMMSYTSGGSIYGMRRGIADTLKLDFDIVVPGHGALVGRSELEAFYRQLDGLIGRLEAAVKAGISKEELLKRVKSDDLSWSLASFAWSSPPQLDGLYNEVARRVRAEGG